MKTLSIFALGAGAAVTTIAIGLAAASFAQADHLRAGEGTLQLAQGNRQQTCLSQRQACLSAGARTGTYGERYVPPEIVQQCYEQYRACTKQR